MDLNKQIEDLIECEDCIDISIKKFSPLRDVINFDDLDSEYFKCFCGKRPLDIVMSHILKIMIEEDIVPETASLRRNSPVPLLSFYYSDLNPQFIGENMLILLHPDFTKNCSSRLIIEVPEVKCVLKGNPKNLVGQFDKESNINHFEILDGDDSQINVMRTLIDEKVILFKNQSKHHIEVAGTTEMKLMQLHNYLVDNNVKKGVAIDAMCGLGALGIYLIKFGFEKVIFNDINPEMIEGLKKNLELNNIFDGFEIYNLPFEDLKGEYVDFCVIDAYPKFDTSEVIDKAEKLADNVLII